MSCPQDPSGANKLSNKRKLIEQNENEQLVEKNTKSRRINNKLNELLSDYKNDIYKVFDKYEVTALKLMFILDEKFQNYWLIDKPNKKNIHYFIRNNYTIEQLSYILKKHLETLVDEQSLNIHGDIHLKVGKYFRKIVEAQSKTFPFTFTCDCHSLQYPIAFDYDESDFKYPTGKDVLFKIDLFTSDVEFIATHVQQPIKQFKFMFSIYDHSWKCSPGGDKIAYVRDTNQYLYSFIDRALCIGNKIECDYDNTKIYLTIVKYMNHQLTCEYDYIHTSLFRLRPIFYQLATKKVKKIHLFFKFDDNPFNNFKNFVLRRDIVGLILIDGSYMEIDSQKEKSIFHTLNVFRDSMMYFDVSKSYLLQHYLDRKIYEKFILYNEYDETNNPLILFNYTECLKVIGSYIGDGGGAAPLPTGGAVPLPTPF